MSEKINKLGCILLIDDDEATNFYHTLIVEEACGVPVQSVKSAKEGLDYLLCRGDNKDCPKPGIIFLDINMPGMNGWEFMAKYHELSTDIQQRAVVAILTTSVNPDDKEKAATIPEVKEFVHKPLTPEVIRKIVSENFA